MNRTDFDEMYRNEACFVPNEANACASLMYDLHKLNEETRKLLPYGSKFDFPEVYRAIVARREEHEARLRAAEDGLRAALARSETLRLYASAISEGAKNGCPPPRL